MDTVPQGLTVSATSVWVVIISQILHSLRQTRPRNSTDHICHNPLLAR